MQYKIEFYETNIKKEKPNPDTLKFGKYFTDYMFIMNYSNEKGWYDAQITKYTPLMLDPGTVVFHYAQSVFEGLKAFQTKTGKLNLFRPERNITRFNISNERLNIPTVDEHLLLQSIIKLVNIEKDWIPKKEGSSLYIRPFIIATDIGLGVRSSNTYKLIIILSPVESYFGNQMKPIKIYVENQYVRAAHGGIGFAKTAGNYAASLKAQSKANLLGYDQVLWLDAIEKKYVEEVGSMNIFFKINGEIITPF